MTMPTITLNNGIVIANFSSRHSFSFDTGEELPGCSEDRARALSLDARETESPSPCGRFIDIRLEFAVSSAVHEALIEAARAPVDIILVPLPVMQAAQAADHPALPKMRTARAADRVRKTTHSTRFCR